MGPKNGKSYYPKLVDLYTLKDLQKHVTQCMVTCIFFFYTKKKSKYLEHSLMSSSRRLTLYLIQTSNSDIDGYKYKINVRFGIPYIRRLTSHI